MVTDNRDAEMGHALGALRSAAGSGVPEAAFKLALSLIAQDQCEEAQAWYGRVFDNLLADGQPDPESLHAGLPVTHGEKWLATLWLRERHYRGY